MAKNGKDTKYTRRIVRRMYLVRNGETCKMDKINWCEGGLQLADIGTTLFSIMVGKLTMTHMFQDQLINPVQKVSTMQHALQEWL